MRLVLKAAMIGCGLTASPLGLASLPTESKAVQGLHTVSSYLLTPGVTLCLIFNPWRVYESTSRSCFFPNDPSPWQGFSGRCLYGLRRDGR